MIATTLKHRLRLGTALAVVLGAVSFAVPGMAFAAPQPPEAGPAVEDEEGDVEELVITGSRIRRDPTTAPTPLIQVERETLLETGLPTIIDYLATIPALANSQVPSDTIGALNISGLSLPNLRSLGAGRTLTLVDGRRHVGSAAGSLAVDTDTVPRLLIDKIEIVTGGASSVYGADAVSGVLNFVMRKDVDGLEVDGNFGQINQNGPNRGRLSVLAGKNFFDERLNVYAFAEYEKLAEIKSLDVDWIRHAYTLVGMDADPAALPFDGEFDVQLFQDLRRLDRPRWGSFTLANNQQPTPTSDPDITLPTPSCTGFTSSTLLSAACYSVDPNRTFWFDPAGTVGGPSTARLANFGQRVGVTGANRPFNIGGDGENPSEFAQVSRTPENEAGRFQVGAGFQLTDSIRASAEVKYIEESSYLNAQPTFFDIFVSNFQGANESNIVLSSSQFLLRLSDNAFLPANLKAAVLANTVQNYAQPTANAPGVPTTIVAAPFATQRMFGPDREQRNDRDLTRYVAAIEGQHDQLAFIKNLNWELSYTFGETNNVNNERAVDIIRFAMAADSVVDTLGLAGPAGGVVCRVQLLAAQGLPIDNYNPNDTRAEFDPSDPEVADCEPLNIFGKTNQSAAALEYVDASINVRERNQQQDAVAFVSGQLWDFWGAGPIGVALGAEWREEKTRGIGRSADAGIRFLFLNTGPDFAEVAYDTTDYFAELSLPLISDSFLGDYAELSGSYRKSDYSTVGEQEVWGANFVYRPVADLAFKTSFNTSIRVPTLSENFRPFTQTFANGFVDPCATANIAGPALGADVRANRVANCTALAAAQGLSFDFGSTTVTTTDDFQPVYASGIAGVNGGNPFLLPEESESFTFSMVIQPRWVPRLNIVLDYFEIEITDVIAAVTAQTAANNCVNGPGLNTAACATIFRETGDPLTPFKVGRPTGHPIGGFIQGSVNFAKRTTRGLDFGGSYSFDAEELIGRDWGEFNVALNGSYLLEQRDFLDPTNPANLVENQGLVFFPQVRFTSTVTWRPMDDLSVSWIVDWQSSQDIIRERAWILNADQRPFKYTKTGDFARQDVTVRYDVDDNLTLRAGVTNIFDAEQARWIGTTLDSNFDPYGRRFNIGLNYKMR